MVKSILLLELPFEVPQYIPHLPNLCKYFGCSPSGKTALSLQEEALPQSVVAKVLFSIPRLNEKEFDLWLTLVDDALLGAGMVALSRVSACKTDDLADPDDVRAVRAYPSWQTNTAWSALRRSIGMDSTAFFRTMSLRTGDVLALLRSLRSFYERRSIPFSNSTQEGFDQDDFI